MVRVPRVQSWRLELRALRDPGHRGARRTSGDDPARYAIFEDFGNDSLIFALYVWFEFQPNASLLVVLSDLRFMIERQFREAGIEIAFPQRDVHLDTTGPLRVELVRGAEPEPK
jgi:potassium efflux system protein